MISCLLNLSVVKPIRLLKPYSLVVMKPRLYFVVFIQKMLNYLNNAAVWLPTNGKPLLYSKELKEKYDYSVFYSLPAILYGFCLQMGGIVFEWWLRATGG